MAFIRSNSWFSIVSAVVLTLIIGFASFGLLVGFYLIFTGFIGRS